MMRMSTVPFLVSILVAIAIASPAVVAQGVAEIQISGTDASARIEIPPYGIDLTISFEQVVGLDAGSLGLSARLVDPLDFSILDRLPSSVAVPVGLPVLVAVEPPATGPLSFSGWATLEVHTHDLDFTAGCPFRIFASHDGGVFEDITDFMGTGSYRGRGRTGGFSDFLILADTREPGAVVDTKLDRLWILLDEHAESIDDEVFYELHQALGSVEAAWLAGDPTGAQGHLDTFARTVQGAATGEIPDVWRSAGDLDNVAGELRAAAATLRFGLSLAL